ncbi:MAG: cysteine--tRNA ligase [Candidatus Bathyarchaeia archaeon]
MSSPIRVYDSMARMVREFKPLRGNRVYMFVCGPTVYDLSHVGHARTYVAYDIMAKYLRLRGYSVFYLMNITDVDDKIIRRSRELGVDPFELAEDMTEEFHRDMRALKVDSVNLYARASEHIDEIIEQVRGLLDKGYAYRLDGDVYYDISRFPDYGRLSGRRPEELVRHRVDPRPGKRSPGDFALWKAEKPGEPSWDSPWGRGRPGWHIEDTAITHTYFGASYDIHGGALELIFPHHEAEIAQMEALTGVKPMVNYWIHTGLLTIGGRKMSKSLKNFVTIREALSRHSPEALRVFFAMTHYRSPIDYDEADVSSAAKFAESLNQAYRMVEEGLGEAGGEGGGDGEPAGSDEDVERVRGYVERFHAYMGDDFNTPRALAAIREFTRFVYKCLGDSPPKRLLREILGAYDLFDSVLGFLDRRGRPGEGRVLRDVLDAVLEVREILRAEGRFDLSDKIRERLEEAGVGIEDTPGGPRWRIR